MAKTMTCDITIRSTVGPNVEQIKSNAISILSTGNHSEGAETSIGTTEESWALPAEIGTEGYVFIQNCDATNFVQIGYATTDYKHRLGPNDIYFGKLEPGVATLYLKADTAACDVFRKAWEA